MKIDNMQIKTTLWVSEERADYIVKEMGSQAQIINTEEDGTRMIEITIESRMDLLNLFHAGIHFGMSRYR
jgi:hypothetical protein